MIHCQDCEFFHRGPKGTAVLTCDPFATIKEPECLLKWQLLQLRTIAQSHEATLEMHRKFAPLQEKMLRHVEREIDEAESADEWKYQEDQDDEGDSPPFR
jgi:hypothetical protein